jgi:hypothetical protein
MWVALLTPFGQGVCRYLVKWKGYEKKSDQTWEPIEHLE